MPALRGHHLVCLFFFNGEGYTPEYIDNLRAAVKRAEGGGVEVVSGADIICIKCPHLRENRCCYVSNAEEVIEGMDRKALDLLEVASGQSISWSELKAKLTAIFPEWYKSFCSDCDWLRVCKNNDLFKGLMAKNMPD
jgi:hypothetical protein